MSEEAGAEAPVMVDTAEGPKEASEVLAALNIPEEAEATIDLGPEAEVETEEVEPEVETEEVEAEIDSLDIEPEVEAEEATEGEPLGVEAFSEYTEEFISTGELKEESRKEILAKHSISPEVLDLVLGGIKAQMKQNTQQALSDAGLTPSEFQELRKWSLENDSPEKLEERRRLLKSTDPSVRGLALRDLKASAAIAAPTAEPVHQRGAPGSDPKLTFDQALAKAMANPLYSAPTAQGDAFRAQVQAQLNKLS